MVSSPGLVTYFDSSATYVAGRSMWFHGVSYRAGEVLPTEQVEVTKSRRILLDTGRIRKAERVPSPEPVAREEFDSSYPVGGTVVVVLDWVGSSQARGNEAVRRELDRSDARSTLISSLGWVED